MAPVVIPENLPASKRLKEENIFVMNDQRAQTQDIRPLEILIINIMPTKIETETQLLRLIGNNLIQVNITLLHMDTHQSKNTPYEHLKTFYNHFENIKNKKFDGLVVTGAPIEKLEYEDVNYWKEFQKILNWADENVFSHLYICWGAMASLNHFYGIKKHVLEKKVFGVYPHQVLNESCKLTRGFDDIVFAPHSRHTELDVGEILNNENLEIICNSPEIGPYIIGNKSRRKIFVIGHPEYDKYTLRDEYVRDLEKGDDINIPCNYFEKDDPENEVIVKWRSHGNLLYSNWINYYVYQETLYDLNREKIQKDS